MVTNLAGEALATSTLSPGLGHNGRCKFGFTVRDVPAVRQYYRITVGSERKLLNETEARSGASLTVGDPGAPPPGGTATPTVT